MDLYVKKCTVCYSKDDLAGRRRAYSMCFHGGESQISCCPLCIGWFSFVVPIHLQFRLFVSNDYDNQLITANHCTLSKRMAFTLFLTMNSVTFWIEGKSYPYPCDDTQCINDYIDSLSVNLVPQFNE